MNEVTSSQYICIFVRANVVSIERKAKVLGIEFRLCFCTDIRLIYGYCIHYIMVVKQVKLEAVVVLA